jgi:hypothetical protein
MFGLTVWRATADRSWALVLPVAGAAVFGVAFLYVAFHGRDPIGRLAAGDRIATICIGLGARDVREVEKLIRASHEVPANAHAHLLKDSPRCRRIAAAAGYAGRQVSVLQMGGQYAVLFSDELMVLDGQLRVVRAQAPKAR